MADEIKDVIRVWNTKANIVSGVQPLKNKQFGATSDTFEIVTKDPAGGKHYYRDNVAQDLLFLQLNDSRNNLQEVTDNGATTTQIITVAGVTSTGTISTTGSISGGTVAGTVSMTTPLANIGNLRHEADQINGGTVGVIVNYKNADGTTANFRDFSIRDGKNAVIMSATGSSKAVQFYGAVTGIEPTASGHFATKNYVDTTKQPLDADLTAIAGLAGATGLARKTALNTWTLDTATYLTAQSLYDDHAITETSTGFRRPATVSLSYNGVAQTVTVGATDAYYQGRRLTEFNSTWTSPAHPTITAGTSLWLFYNGSTFQWASAPTNGFADLLIARIYRDGVNVCIRECHGLMPPQDHEALHYAIGALNRGGGDVSTYVLNSTTVANRRPNVSATTVADEDLLTNLPSHTNKLYTQMIMSGANTATLSVDNADIIPLNGNIPYWYNYNGSTWAQTAFGVNEYGKAFLIAIPVSDDATCQKARYVWIAPQTVSTSLATIEGVRFSSVVLGQIQTSVQEFVPIAEAIIRYSANNWTLIQVNKISGSLVAQQTSSGGGGTFFQGSDNQIIISDGLGGHKASAATAKDGVLQVLSNGDMRKETSATMRHYLRPIGGDFVTILSPLTNGIKILLPTAWNNTMWDFRVDIYSLDQPPICLHINGYAYGSPNNYWYIPSVVIESAGTEPVAMRRVRFAYDSVAGKCCLILGNETGMTWKYTNVHVRDVYAQYALSGTDGAWAISTIADLTGITGIVEPTPSLNATTISGVALSGLSQVGHSHVSNDITDFQSSVTNNTAVLANTAKVTNATHTGDVTGATALTIANDAVTNAKMANMGSNTIKGAVSAGDPIDLTPAQVLTMLNTAGLYQPLDSDLTALAGLTTTGVIIRTGSGTVATRTITGSNGITVINGDGVAGAPTISPTYGTTANTIAQGNHLHDGTYVKIVGDAMTGGLSLPQLHVISASGVVSPINLAVGANPADIRWQIYKNTTAEGTGDVGGDLVVVARGNTGSLIDVPVLIGRKAGTDILLQRPTVISGLKLSGSDIFSNNTDIYLNRLNLDGTTTNFRATYIYDGKGAQMFRVLGASSVVESLVPLTVPNATANGHAVNLGQIGFSQGTFTATMTGTSSTITTTVRYVKIGSMVTISWKDVSTPSNSEYFGFSGIPEVIRPVDYVKTGTAEVYVGSSNIGCRTVVTPTGELGIVNIIDGTSNTFSNTGEKNLLAGCITYSIL